MEEEFYDSIIESLRNVDSFDIQNLGDLLNFTEEEKFNKWVEKIGLVKNIDDKITLSWPIKLSEFKELFLAGNFVEYHDWINSLELKMDVNIFDFHYTLYYEKESKAISLLTIWKTSENKIEYNSYCRYFDIDTVLLKIDELKIVIPALPKY